MFRKLAVAAVLVVLAAGSVASATDINRWSTSGDAEDRPTEEARLYDSPGDDTFFDVYARDGLTDAGAGGLYDSPGDDTFFDVFTERPIIDDGDAGFMTEALWLELLGW